MNKLRLLKNKDLLNVFLSEDKTQSSPESTLRKRQRQSDETYSLSKRPRRAASGLANQKINFEASINQVAPTQLSNIADRPNQVHGPVPAFGGLDNIQLHGTPRDLQANLSNAFATSNLGQYAGLVSFPIANYATNSAIDQERDRDYAIRRLRTLESDQRMLIFERNSIMSSLKTMEDAVQKERAKLADLEDKLASNKKWQARFKED